MIVDLEKQEYSISKTNAGNKHVSQSTFTTQVSCPKISNCTKMINKFSGLSVHSLIALKCQLIRCVMALKKDPKMCIQ